jgi:alkylhydroperoxidase family enzyme
MALVKLLETGDLPEDVQPMARSGEEQYGKLLLTWRAIFNTPKIFNTYLPFLRSVAGPGLTKQSYKDLSALYVGVLNNCKYTMVHRYNAAIKNGAAPEIVQAVVTRKWSELPSEFQLLLQVTEILTLKLPHIAYEESHDLMSPELRSALTANFSDSELTEYIMSISAWNALARFHRVMNFEMDMPSTPDYFEEIYAKGSQKI